MKFCGASSRWALKPYPMVKLYASRNVAPARQLSRSGEEEHETDCGSFERGNED